MIATRMSPTRRVALFAFLAPVAPQGAAQQQEPDVRRPLPDRIPDDDVRLPNGKSQKDAISKQAHEDALKDVESLIHLAEDLRDELKHSGEYVVAVSSLRKTEEIEKLARHIRGKLKA
jgi:hypothetical protein